MESLRVLLHTKYIPYFLLPTSTQVRNHTNRKRKCTRTPKSDNQKHTTGGIPRWSPTLVLVARFSAYVWQSGRDAQFSLTYGRMWHGGLCRCIDCSCDSQQIHREDLRRNQVSMRPWQCVMFDSDGTSALFTKMRTYHRHASEAGIKVSSQSVA